MPARAAAAALLATGLLLTSCADDGDSVTTTTSPSGSADPGVIGELCGVLELLRDGELDLASRAFDHRPLHTLADEVVEVDRAVAARLLEAKEAVESRFASPVLDATSLVPDLEALVTATRDAQAASGDPTGACDEDAA